jgi:hypothetical protein
MPDDPYKFAVDHLEVGDWLLRECDKVSERYFAIIKIMDEKEQNFENPSDEDVKEMEDVHSHMRELENRFVFEEKQYAKVIKKLDDMDEF